jgi:hypothetical protein
MPPARPALQSIAPLAERTKQREEIIRDATPSKPRCNIRRQRVLPVELSDSNTFRD